MEWSGFLNGKEKKRRGERLFDAENSVWRARQMRMGMMM
jgi:hypothetical protein